MNRNDVIFKFNSGMGAILCSKCRVIIKVGSEFTELEKLAMRGERELKAQYCEKCKKRNEETD